MSFVSYAQNFEDVILWRALKHVEQGFYIDIGAAWPDQASVTKAFYERGWRGINVEPNPELNVKLCLHRRRDTNLQLAIGDTEDILTMNFVPDSGLSTLDDAIAEKHVAAGWTSNRRKVQVKTLSSIWIDYVPNGQEVHFLNVDVEGFEEAVLRGNDWDKNRPWVVVVEATMPLSQEETYKSWEPVLFEAQYRLAYGDGVNRFYVAQEHTELLPKFKYPPNVFDDFKLSSQKDAENCAVQAEVRARQAEARTRQAEVRAQQAEARAQQAEARAKDIINSASWRITAPLRSADSVLRLLVPVGLKSGLEVFMKHAVHYVGRRPKLVCAALGVLDRMPGLKSLLERVMAAVLPDTSFTSNVSSESAQLAPHARQIYIDLKSAVEREKNRV